MDRGIYEDHALLQVQYLLLREANLYLEKRNQIHDIFSKLSLTGADLVKIVGRIEQMLGLPLALLDITKNEWYPPGSPLARDPACYGAGGEADGRARPRTVTPAGEKPCYLYPVAHEGLVLGYFVAELGRELQPLDIIILEHGETAAALEMLNNYSLTERNYKRGYAFFQELLPCHEPKLLAARCGNYGLDPELPLFVMLLQPADKEESAKRRETYLRRLIAQLQNVLGPGRHMLFCMHDTITILIHAAGPARQNSLIEDIKSALAWLDNNETPLFQGGVGNLYTGLENIAKSSWEANNALLYLARKGLSGVMLYQDIGVNRLFLKQHPWEIQRFIQEVLAPLRTPAAQAANLEETLKAYIAANRSAAQTAGLLHIHQNTLYHRLGKIRDALDMDINDPDDLLKLHLACHLDEGY